MGIRTGGYGLEFIDSKKLFTAVERLVGRVIDAKSNVDLHKNVIDPFGAIFEAGLVAGLNSEEWLKVERARQINKSLSNAIGDMHQELIGYLPGWESTGLNGGVIDLIHDEPFGVMNVPVIAELKNKHNTMNSATQDALHSRLQDALKWPAHKGYAAYLIEVVPRTPGGLDEAWAPAGRGKTDRIRKIDARSVYKASSGGDHRAFEKLFDALPHVLIDVVGETSDMLVLQEDDGFRKLFNRAI